MDQSIFCKQCNYQFLDENVLETRQPCPQCNCIIKSVTVIVRDTLEIHDGYGLKVKNPEKRQDKKKKHIIEQADKTYRDHQKRLIKKFSLKDREKNLYQEKVEDLETGEVIRNISEPLSQHQGFGSAKFKKADQTQENDNETQ